MISEFKQGKCLICDSDAMYRHEYWQMCPNKCTAYMIGGPYLHLSIFGKYYHNLSWKNFQQEVKVIDEINYWRENDRYLMAVLTDGE